MTREADMATKTVGDRSVFAIEYRLFSLQRVEGHAGEILAFGNIRLWAGSRSLGNIEDSMFLDSMLQELDRIRLEGLQAARLYYIRPHDIVPLAQMLDLGGWSWGPAFDEVDFVFYAVEAEKSLHFIWALSDFDRDSLPKRSPTWQHAVVPLAAFNGVLEQVINEIYG